MIWDRFKVFVAELALVEKHENDTIVCWFENSYVTEYHESITH